MQDPVFNPQPQDALNAGALHPAGRTGVPGPPASSEMLPQRINIRCHDIRFDLVSIRVGTRTGVVEADLDGVPVGSRPLKLSLDDDGAVHRLTVRLG